MTKPLQQKIEEILTRYSSSLIGLSFAKADDIQEFRGVTAQQLLALFKSECEAVIGQDEAAKDKDGNAVMTSRLVTKDSLRQTQRKLMKERLR